MSLTPKKVLIHEEFLFANKQTDSWQYFKFTSRISPLAVKFYPSPSNLVTESASYPLPFFLSSENLGPQKHISNHVAKSFCSDGFLSMFRCEEHILELDRGMSFIKMCMKKFL